ncbi:MAG TPA: glycosyltransferase [Fimbriimonadales bacterium]|nr:glycosyltransferase [Fimbriimonadales bacterium]
MKVTFLTRHDGGLASGGREVQLGYTLRALNEIGIETEILTPLTTKIGDVLHVFGPEGYFADTARYARERQVPVVTSSVWYLPLPIWRVWLRRYWLTLRFRYPKQTKKLFKRSTLLVCPSHAAQKRIVAFFGIDPKKFRFIPSAGVDERFANATPELFREHTGIREDFVLHVGVIHKRKNQLNLIRALKGTNFKMVFLGRLHSLEYAARCKREAGEQAMFLDAVSHDSPLLPSAYAAARVVCIPSILDDFLIAGIEAGAAGARLVLSNSWHPQELYGDYALYPNPFSPTDIRRCVEIAWDKPHDPEAQREYFIKRYSWSRIAEQLKTVYEEAVGLTCVS